MAISSFLRYMGYYFLFLLVAIHCLGVCSFCPSSNSCGGPHKHKARTSSFSPEQHVIIIQNNNTNKIKANKAFSLILTSATSNSNNNENGDKMNLIDPDTLMDMDIIIYTIKGDETQQAYIGAIQEDMTLAPLSAWTTEPAFGSSIEFVVDEEDRWKKELEFDNVIVKALLSEDMFSYGSRQVGGGKGPGNPHGEESELIYYVENDILEKENIDIPIKPELEILW